MDPKLSFQYDREADILHIDMCPPYAEQETEELPDEVVARLNPNSGEVENLEYLLNKGRERCQVAAGWGLGTGARWLMRSARRGISARPVMRSVM